MAIALALLVLLATPAAALADILVPPGFVVDVYVTAEGFDTSAGRSARGLPSSSTLAVDGTGTLYMARSGRRYSGGEIDDLWPIFRFPPGGARVTKDTAPGFLYGPPLPSAQVAGLRGDGQLLVTTFDRDRKVGVLYVMVNGHAELFAGGTPARRSMAPVLVQPEGAAIDAAGNTYVADRARDTVLKLDARGAIVDAGHVSVKRPRLLAIGSDGALWIAADGGAEAPWQRGPGEIWRRTAAGVTQLVRHGPVATGMSLAPSGHLFVADR
ncbi:MAG TPA: hypothetical protein VMR23_15635, partial [Candidatus Limnocylindria bacterium]|nr:hypothetical protein [Candidatus Limnocylindria bacterium]